MRSQFLYLYLLSFFSCLRLGMSAVANEAVQHAFNLDPLQHEPETINGNSAGELESQFTLREQTDELCDARTRQWTGSVKVSEEKSIFYWFFESRNAPQNDPVVVWLNGGPGGSSLLGLFIELGPCLVNKNGNSTAFNPYSWANNASMLYIDQPSGVGFSKVTNSSYIPTGLATAAEDFNVFLSIFFTDIFSGLAHLPLHVAGESFGGHYVPYYTPLLLERQRTKAAHHLPLTLSSIILVNAVLDWSPLFAGQYDYFCAEENGENGVGTGFNETACRAMTGDIPEAERLGALCRDTYDVEVCNNALGVYSNGVGRWFHSDVGTGGRNPYDGESFSLFMTSKYPSMCNSVYRLTLFKLIDRQNCTKPPFCGHLGFERLTTYLNAPWVQSKLGFTNHSFSPNADEVTMKWQASGAVAVPTTREMTWILDNTDLGVLVINGNNDVVV